MRVNAVQRTITIISVVLIGFLAPRLFAIEETLVLKVDDGQSILRMENTRLVEGKRGLPELVLADTEYELSDNTEALLHFNGKAESTGSPYYSYLNRSWEAQSAQTKRGEAAALFDGSAGGSTLSVHNGALFYPGTFVGSFSLEFWAMTPSYKEGQSIFRWEGKAWLTQKIIPQTFEVSLVNRSLVWNFDKFFIANMGDKSGADPQTLSFALKNRRELIPGTWYHHFLRYDAQEGKLEYFLNGISEDVRYATKSGRLESQKYQAYSGERSKNALVLGAGYRGFLDEFRIERGLNAVPQTEGKIKSGYAIFTPIRFIDIGAGSKILTINAATSTQGQSEVKLYWFMIPAKPGAGIQSLMPPARIERNDPRWKVLQPGKALDGDTSGLYLMLKAEFLPDGSGESRPGLQDVRISYIPDPPPPAPSGLTVEAGESSLKLRWNSVPVSDLAGYVVYYGTKPGQYFGDTAFEGASPIDVGKVNEFVLTGLENYRVYYIVVASYDRSNDPKLVLSMKRSLTREVSARPAP